jgi:molybdate transport system substrate-binding protein
LAALMVSTVALAQVAGCSGVSGGEGAGGRKQQGGTLTILAASSLIDAFGVLANRVEEQNPGVRVRQSFESSSTLLAHIQQRAPADVFASAAEEMNTAIKDGLVKGEAEVFVKNREIVMVPKNNPANIRRFQDVAKPDVKLVLAGKDVPAADCALQILGEAKGEYGAGFEKEVLSNVV